MDIEMVVLRLIHIISGSFWVGGAILLTFVVVPRVRAMGPEFYGPVMGSVVKVASPVLMGSGLITIVFGTILALRLRWGHLDDFYATGWGYAITIGAVTAVVALALGGVAGATGKRLGAVAASAAGGPPSPEQMAEMQRLDAKLTLVTRFATVLVIIAVGSMASARFV